MNTPMCSTWRTGADGTIGVVLYYCGNCLRVHGAIGIASGSSAKHDAQRVADYGAKITFAEAKGFFPTLLPVMFAERDCA